MDTAITASSGYKPNIIVSNGMVHSTVKFNVGGVLLEVSTAYLYQFPTLTRFIGTKDIHFLDYNPLAFMVILDYLRTKQLFIPRNVNKDLVIWILNELQIPFQDVVETNLEMKNHMIPAGLCLPNHLDSERSIQMPNQASNLPSSSMASSLDTTFKRNEQTFERYLSSHQKILLRRTEPIMFQSILPLIRKHIRLGHTQLQIYIIPNEIKPHTIANEKITQEYTFPKEFLVLYPEMNGPDLLFLLQPDVMLLMNRLIENYQPTGDCQTSVQNLTTRIETPVGLFESRSFDLLVLTIRFYVQ